jgi:hypothetical protein
VSVGNWLSYLLNALQAVAIVVGGFFAYYKFVRGRTFHRRAELSVDAELIDGASEPKAVRRTSSWKTPVPPISHCG